MELPAATFVAVGPRESSQHEATEAMRAERRAVDRRLSDAALQAVATTLPVVALPSLAVVPAVLYLKGFSALPLLWAAAALLVCSAWAVVPWTLWRHPRWVGDTRQQRLLVVLLALLCMLTLALAPWLPERPGVAGERWVLELALTVAALMAALALAPMGASALPAMLLMLSPALAGLARSGLANSGAWAQVWIGVGLCATMAWLGFWRHRSWAAMQRALIVRDDRIRTLEAACDMAIRADRDKTRFLAVASHDLRQPMHALGLFAATLEKRLQGSVEEPLVRNVMHSIDGLERSFNAMLDVSRLDAGTVEPNIQYFPLRDLFRRLHMHFVGQAEQAGLGLRFSPGGKSVSSDPQLLERIVGNLIQNAIKYTERGGIVVVARSTATHVNVEVWDTGVGIRPEDLPRVFDEFCQVGRERRARAQGLGMGLAIVRRLARLLGHQLTVRSCPGRGTMFRIGIPIGGLPDIQDATAAADTLPMPVMLPRSVLVIDDEAPIREGLRMLLEEWGYQVISAATMREAELAVRALEMSPDLILSDLHLGDGPDGIATIEAVRRQCGHEVPAILVTGDTSHEEMRRATDSGHPVLFKPLQARKLFNALRGMTS